MRGLGKKYRHLNQMSWRSMLYGNIACGLQNLKMASEPQQSQGKIKEKKEQNAKWSPEGSIYFLEVLVTQHKCSKGGDNGLKPTHLAEIAERVNSALETTYESSQIKNHYRVWRLRIKALMDLINCSGLGWNDQTSRFDGPKHLWAGFQKPEHTYWRNRDVLPIHKELLVWFGNEIATGQDASPTDDVHTEDINFVDMTLGADNDASSQPTPSDQRSASRTRGASDAFLESSSKNKKKKKDKTPADKVASPLKHLANAFDKFVDIEYLPDISKRLTVALQALPSLDVRQRMAAKRYLLNNKTDAQEFLDYDDEEKLIMLEDRVLGGDGSSVPRNLFG